MVRIPGRAPFAMISLEGEVDSVEALRIARLKWQNAEVF